MPMSDTTRNLVIASFVALSVGFLAGWWMGSQTTEAPEPAATAPSGAPHPVGAQEYLQLGMQALGAGDFETAEVRFRRAVELQPGNPAAHADLAVALMYQERWEEAREHLERAKEIEPGMPEVYFLEGLVYRDAIGDTARAEEAWERFLAMVPEDSPQAASVRQWLAELRGGAPPDTAAETGADVPDAPVEPPTEGR